MQVYSVHITLTVLGVCKTQSRVWHWGMPLLYDMILVVMVSVECETVLYIGRV